MKMLKDIKKKVMNWFVKKNEKNEINPEIISQQQNLEEKLNKLNSRLSLVAEKLENVIHKEEAIECYCEQILHEISGSNDTNEVTSKVVQEAILPPREKLHNVIYLKNNIHLK